MYPHIHTYINTYIHNIHTYNVHTYIQFTYIHTYINTYIPEFLINFEAWTKLAQKWLVCAPLGMHLEPINKELMLLVTI